MSDLYYNRTDCLQAVPGQPGMLGEAETNSLSQAVSDAVAWESSLGNCFSNLTLQHSSAQQSWCGSKGCCAVCGDSGALGVSGQGAHSSPL